MSEMYAYRASDEFAEALRAWNREHHEFTQAVIVPINDEAAPHQPVFVRSALRMGTECVGFADNNAPTSQLPPGLSRSQSRSYLIPKRGKAGDEWRDRMQRCNTGRPSLEAVFNVHQVDPVSINSGRGRMARAGMRDFGDVTVLHCTLPLDESPHLTPMPLSEYYALVESDPSDAATPGGGS